MKRLLLLLALFAPVAFAAAPTLTATPSSGVGSVTTTLAWTCDAGSAAVGTGAGFAGSKAASGSQSVAVSATTVFTISCTPAAVTGALLSWTAPTTYIDGTPMSDLAGFKVYSGASAGSLSLLTTIASPTTTTYTVTGLNLGTRYFAVSAYTAQAESAKSSVGSKTITAPVAQAASATVTVTPNIPSAPVLTVADIASTGYSPAFKYNSDGTRSDVLAGFVAVGKACSGSVVFTYRGAKFRRVAVSDVRWWATSQTSRVAAACG